MQGLDITFDIYPYTAGCTMLRAVLPPWVMEGGNVAAIERLSQPEVRARVTRELASQQKEWDNLASMAGWRNLMVVQLKNPANARFVGKNLEEIAAASKEEPADVLMDLLVSEEMEGFIIAQISSEQNIRKAICSPYGMFGSDSMHTPDEMGLLHPHAYGAFARYFAKYVREEEVLRMEEAVRKASALPAARFGLQDRGLVRIGMAADLVVLDPERIQDRATFLQPRKHAEGVVHVLVNGEVALENGETTGTRSGRVLRAR